MALTEQEIKFIDESCNWSIAKNWAEWWMRQSHLQMLHKGFSCMDSSARDRCPSTTNAVEHRNAECKSKQPVALQHALTNVYKLDKSVCAKHLAALDGCSVSYRDRSENARRSAAKKRQEQRLAANIPDDPTALQGPPDRACHFDKLGKR